MGEVACEHGAANVSVAQVVARAGVSRRTFYEIFCDCEDCLLAAIEDAVERARERILPAHGSSGRWAERMRASMLALLRFCDEEPVLGRLLVVESLRAGSRALALRLGVLAELRAAVDAGRGERAGACVSSITAESVVGGALAVIQARMLEGDRTVFAELANPLTSMLFLPYLGLAAARRELARPAPAQGERAERRARPSGGRLPELPMRLTYRTVRVIAALAETPGASNRQVGDAADVTDQGQISKLLRRLQRLGLVVNAEDGAARGTANAWELTDGGWKVHETIAGHRPGVGPDLRARGDSTRPAAANGPAAPRA